MVIVLLMLMVSSRKRSITTNMKTDKTTCSIARQLPLSKLFKTRSCRSCCDGSSHSGAKAGLEQTIRFK